jgi:hypothetical protein
MAVTMDRVSRDRRVPGRDPGPITPAKSHREPKTSTALHSVRLLRNTRKTELRCGWANVFFPAFVVRTGPFALCGSSPSTVGGWSHDKDGVAKRVEQVEGARAPLLVSRGSKHLDLGAPLTVIRVSVVHPK